MSGSMRIDGPGVPKKLKRLIPRVAGATWNRVIRRLAGRPDADPAEPRFQTLEPYRFNPARGTWQRERDVQSAIPDRLILVTFNIWFGEFRWRERLAAVLDIIRTCRADVIALQEVMPRHLEPILSADWVRDEFSVSDIDGETLQPHGVLTLSRLPVRGFGLCALPSAKARKLLIAEIGLGERALCIGNLHLESSGGATPVRLQQLDTVLPSVHVAQHAVLMGDFNFDPIQWPEQSRVEAQFRDLWAELRGDDPGYTEDTDVNRMRLLHKNKEKQVRFDRVLLRTSRPGWVPESIRLIGTRPIDADGIELFPSDHFGLTASLTWDAGAAETESG